MVAVLGYLDRIDPESAQRARSRYACFDHYGEDTRLWLCGGWLTKTCEDDVIAQLQDLHRRGEELSPPRRIRRRREFFFAEQNARLVKNAERYYRSMFQGRVSSWNLRDQHMAETLTALMAHLSRRQPQPKIVVWAHNSHLGDARATQMGESGELNVGQSIRERYGREAVLIGFSTYRGTVTAASDWDGPMERKAVQPALADSYEALFHEVGIPRFLLTLNDDSVVDPLK